MTQMLFVVNLVLDMQLEHSQALLFLTGSERYGWTMLIVRELKKSWAVVTILAGGFITVGTQKTLEWNALETNAPVEITTAAVTQNVFQRLIVICADAILVILEMA